jgi:hypothetical protein
MKKVYYSNQINEKQHKNNFSRFATLPSIALSTNDFSYAETINLMLVV